MIIGKDGKEWIPSPLKQTVIPNHDHRAFVLWEAFVSMIAHRNAAVRLHNRCQRIRAKIAANPTHKDVSVARERMSQLEAETHQEMLTFLKWEASAHDYWEDVPGPVRVDQAMDEWFNVDIADMELPPLWHHPLGVSSEEAPEECRIPGTVIQFSPPVINRVYRKVRR